MNWAAIAIAVPLGLAIVGLPLYFHIEPLASGMTWLGQSINGLILSFLNLPIIAPLSNYIVQRPEIMLTGVGAVTALVAYISKKRTENKLANLQQQKLEMEMHAYQANSQLQTELIQKTEKLKQYEAADSQGAVVEAQGLLSRSRAEVEQLRSQLREANSNIATLQNTITNMKLKEQTIVK